MNSIARQYYEAKQIADEAKREMDACKVQLLAMMDAANVNALVVDGFTVTRSDFERMAFDSKAFRADFGDVYEEYKRPQTVHRFDVQPAA